MQEKLSLINRRHNAGDRKAPYSIQGPTTKGGGNSLPPFKQKMHEVTEMIEKNFHIIPRLLLLLFIVSMIIGISSADAAFRYCPGPDCSTCYDWSWYKDDSENALWEYYYCLHMLTGWSVPLIEFVEKVSPEDLATMPPEMYNFFKEYPAPIYPTGGTMHRDDGTWQFDGGYHMWTSPEGYIYNGDLPPYQWLIWMGWEEYADHLPEPPPGAPFPAPPYTGTPKNTLPIAKIPPHTGNFYGPMECPIPDAIAINNPKDPGFWDWTDELKEALSALGLDPDIANTRLGYEKSGTTITMVGMTPSGVMKEWTLTLSKGGWTCDSTSAEELENILFILKKIDAISDNSVAASVPAVTEKNSLTSLKSLISDTLNARIQPEFTTNPASLLAAKGLTLNETDMNAVKGVNSSAVQKSSIVSGKSSIAAIPDRSELLSRTGTVTQRTSLASAKAAGVLQKGSQARARG